MNTKTKRLMKQKMKQFEKWKLVVLAFLLFFYAQNVAHAATYYSIASGNWNSASIWSTSSGGSAGTNYPIAGDTVVIEGGKTVTVNTASACASVIIGYASAGTLSFSASQSLTVSDSVKVVATNGTLNMSSGGTLNVGGNFTNAGTFSSGSGTLVMNGSSTQTLKNSSGYLFVKNLTINNSSGVNMGSDLNISGALTLTSGIFAFNGKTFQIINGVSAARTNGKIDLSTSNLNSQLNTSNSISFPSGFFYSPISSITLASTTSTVNFATGDTITVGSINSYGHLVFDYLILLGDAWGPSGAIGYLEWRNSTTSTLIIGDGTNRTCYAIATMLSCPNLIVNCGTGTVYCGRSDKTGGTSTITKSITLTSGTLNINTYATSFVFSGTSITRTSGTILVNSTSASTGLLTFSNTSTLNLPSNLFSSNSLTNLTINASNAIVYLGGSLLVTGALALTDGTLYCINVYTLTYSGDSISRLSGTIDVSNGTMAFANSNALSLPAGMFANSSLNNLTLNGSGGVSLGGDLTVTGTMTLSAGTLSTGTNTLTYSGSSITRSTGYINASSGTMKFTNTSALSLPISMFTGSLNNLTLNGGGGISLGGDLTVGGTLALSKGTLTTGTKILTYSGSSITRSTGKINAIGGTLSFTNSSALTVPVSVFVGDSISNLQISGSGSLTLGGTCRIAASKSVTVTSPGVLNTGGNLILTGSTSTPAYIANSSGTINGNVTVEVAVPSGRRAFRLLSHPFSSSIALSSLQDNIHITGVGGANNGFDSTLNNNPSAYSFAESGYTGTTNTGWTAFTNTTNTIGANTALRILYRGPRSQSNLLDGSTPTPNAGTLDWSGPVNQGSQNIAMSYTSANGSNAGWNLIPNPYPSNVNIGNIASGNRNSIGTFSVWVPTNGTKGGWSTYSFGSAYIVPSGGAFFVKTASAANFTFTESSKTGSSATESLLKTAAQESNALELSLSTNDTLIWDKIVLKQKDGSLAEMDAYDGPKMANPDVNFYSLSADKTQLAIDCRSSFTNKDKVLLGITNAGQWQYTLKTNYANIPNTQAYLIDTYLNTRTKLSVGSKYTFTTSIDSASFGENRFWVEFMAIVNGVNAQEEIEPITLFPNPSQDKVYLKNIQKVGEKIEYKVMDISGKELLRGNAIPDAGENLEININPLVSGLYFIELSHGSYFQTMKLIKK
ncbi:MAG: hypothetical protein CFE21_02600 [Bacteroidetes bacterium B1(2017)]|nr:MAG: hypothetical protein CFE21_02600 [Bacteroidetes bacterium B1(2017)]